MEPALRFKHSLAEVSILNQKRAAHSLVEPANIIKLKRHTLQEQSTIQTRGAEAGISTVSTNVTKDVSSSKPSPNWWSSRTMASNNSGNVSRGIVTKAKSSSGNRSGEKCWWNQPRQNLVRSAGGAVVPTIVSAIRVFAFTAFVAIYFTGAILLIIVV